MARPPLPSFPLYLSSFYSPLKPNESSLFLLANPAADGNISGGLPHCSFLHSFFSFSLFQQASSFVCFISVGCCIFRRSIGKKWVKASAFLVFIGLCFHFKVIFSYSSFSFRFLFALLTVVADFRRKARRPAVGSPLPLVLELCKQFPYPFLLFFCEFGRVAE